MGTRFTRGGAESLLSNLIVRDDPKDIFVSPELYSALTQEAAGNGTTYRGARVWPDDALQDYQHSYWPTWVPTDS